jgi:dipeptidyl aminopeptidase/acylaminoacyl peptidase
MQVALSKQGVDSVFLFYRGEGHGLQRPENQRDLLTRALEWIESRVK